MARYRVPPAQWPAGPGLERCRHRKKLRQAVRQMSHPLRRRRATAQTTATPEGRHRVHQYSRGLRGIRVPRRARRARHSVAVRRSGRRGDLRRRSKLAAVWLARKHRRLANQGPVQSKKVLTTQALENVLSCLGQATVVSHRVWTARLSAIRLLAGAGRRRRRTGRAPRGPVARAPVPARIRHCGAVIGPANPAAGHRRFLVAGPASARARCHRPAPQGRYPATEGLPLLGGQKAVYGRACRQERPAVRRARRRSTARCGTDRDRRPQPRVARSAPVHRPPARPQQAGRTASHR